MEKIWLQMYALLNDYQKACRQGQEQQDKKYNVEINDDF